MTLFGHKSEFTSTKGEKRNSEIWFSDLGVVVAADEIWPAEAKERITAVTDIRRTEPDPKLFEIPEGSHANSVGAPKPLN